MITAYLLMLASLTDFSAVNPFKDEIAWVMLGSILLNIGINILKAAVDIYNVTKLHLRRMQAIRAQKERIESKQSRMKKYPESVWDPER